MRRYSRRRKSSDASQLFIVIILLLGGGAVLSQAVQINVDSYMLVFYLLVLAVILGGMALLYFIYRRERKRLKALSQADVDHMTGAEFERYIGEILKSQGFHITYTPASGDYGTDIVAVKGERKISIQLKRYSKPVGVEAVYQAVGSLKYYGSNEAMVVTNSTFTPAARTLALANNCTLVDKKLLADWIIEFQQKK